MRQIFLLTMAALASFLFGVGPPEAEAQTDTISVDIYGYGAVQSVGSDCEFQDTGSGLKLEGIVGTTYQCGVWAIDADGEWTPGRVGLAIVNPTFVDASIENDSILVYTILRKGNARIQLWPIPSLLLAFYYPGKHKLGMEEWIDTIPPFSYTAATDALTGELIPGAGVATTPCAYLDSGDGYAGAKAKGVPNGAFCPDLGGEPLPSFEVAWTFPDGKLMLDGNSRVILNPEITVTEPFVIASNRN